MKGEIIFIVSYKESHKDLSLLLLLLTRVRMRKPKGPDTPDAIRQRDAIFLFSLTDNFDPSLNFPNI